MSENAPLAVMGATAFVGPGLAPVPDSVVVTDGHSIAAGGGRGEIEVPDDARVLDVTGLALLPGFIDSHVHIGLADASAVLRGGVTTVRDLGWPLSEIVPAAAAEHRVCGAVEIADHGVELNRQGAKIGQGFEQPAPVLALACLLEGKILAAGGASGATVANPGPDDLLKPRKR